MHTRALLVVGAAMVCASGCEHAPARAVEACGKVLAHHVPTSRVIAAELDAGGGATLDFEVGDWWTPPVVRGRVTCSFDSVASGGLRLRNATLDGVELTAAERTAINADLLLADLRAAGRKAARGE